MRGTFRRDLTLAPGPEFRLTRRLSARILSVVLALAAIGWGVFDLWAGYRVVGAATAVLAVAFVVQLVQAELATWRFEGAELRSARLRVPAAEIAARAGLSIELPFGAIAAPRAWEHGLGEITREDVLELIARQGRN